MDLLLTPMSDRVTYFIDCACEHNEMTTAAYYALRGYGDRLRLDQIYDMHGENPRRMGWKGRGEICFAYERYAKEIIDQLDPRRRAVLYNYAADSMGRVIRDMADFLARSNFEDQTKGGCLEPYRRQVRLKGLEPTPRARRRLYGRRAIRKYVHDYDEWFTQVGLRSVWTSLVPEFVPEEADYELVEGDYRRQREAFRAHGLAEFNREEHEREQWAIAINRVAGGEDIMDVLREVRRNGQVKPKITPEMKRREKKRRRMLIRASAIAAAVLGVSSVAAFAKGQPVRIEGERVDFVVARGGSIAASGHGALDIALHERGGQKLAGLCYYEKNAPALDQLVSIAMHVAAGEEADLIRIGNLFSINRDAHQHPVIEEKERLRSERAVAQIHEVAVWSGGTSGTATNSATTLRFSTATSSSTAYRPDMDHNAFAARVTRYVSEVFDTYRDTVAAKVLGREADHPFMREILAA